jgi:hypothetical protein
VLVTPGAAIIAGDPSCVRGRRPGPNGRNEPHDHPRGGMPEPVPSIHVRDSPLSMMLPRGIPRDLSNCAHRDLPVRLVTRFAACWWHLPGRDMLAA